MAVEGKGGDWTGGRKERLADRRRVKNKKQKRGCFHRKRQLPDQVPSN